MKVSLAGFSTEASRFALMGSILTFAAFAGGGRAVAQDQPAAGAAPMEEIVVTGSHIRSNDMTAAEPLTVVTATEINETKAINLEQYLGKLPSIDFNGFAAANNNGGLGATEASIHQLQVQRTLVLVNGFRMVGTDTQSTYAGVDLNNIPLPMVDHIEVLRDGASPIYGADAIAGVINIITKKDWTGFQVDGGVGETDKQDGLQYNGSALLGIGNDRSNVIINLSYDNRNPILQADRGWSSKQYRDNNTPDGALIGATSGRPPGLRLIDGFGPTLADGVTPNPNYTVGAQYFGGIHNNLVLSPGDRFDLTKIPYLIGQEERKSANLYGHYDITDDIKAVIEGFYTDRTSEERLNPEPIDFATTTIKYPNGFILPYCIGATGGNTTTGCAPQPGYPTGVNPNAIRAGVLEDQLARTRRFEGGPRNYTDAIDTYRLRIGLEGTIGDDYNWDAGYVYGRSDATYRTFGEVNFTHFFQLAGLVPCGVDAATGCHIANIVGDNTLTKQEIAYAQFINTQTSQVEQDFAYGNISGPIPFVPELPGGTVKFSAGFEYRNESTFDNPDSVVVNGDGQANQAPTRGAYNVAAGFAEFDAPIFKDIPWVKALTLTGAVRYDNYNTFGSATTWKANVDYAPTEDVRFRLTRSTGLRAPSIKELFGGNFQNFESVTDPCDTALGSVPGSAGCVSALKAVGVNPANFVAQITQAPTINGGTASLQPETSQTWDAGVVFTPSFVPGLSLGVDYWDVYIRNQIVDGVATQQILNNCYQFNTASSCALITRGPSGDIVNVVAPNLNFGFEHTRGIDVDASYIFGVSDIGIDRPGSINLTGSTTYLMHDTQYNAPGSLPYDAAGTWFINGGSTVAEPRFRALVNATYSEDNWSASVTERYTGGVTLLQGTPGQLGNNAPGVFYTDIAVTYTYDIAKFVVGVDNLIDKTPPFINDLGTNSSANAYDYVGRYLYFKTTVKFGAESAPTPAAAYVPPPVQAPMAAPSVAHSYMVFFDFNKSDLTPQAVSIVDQAASNASPAKATELTVTGHTDTVGSDAYNMRLSRRRAESVAAELEKRGIASSEIEIVARGKRDLLVPTGDGVREPQNRRVTIVYGGAGGATS